MRWVRKNLGWIILTVMLLMIVFQAIALKRANNGLKLVQSNYNELLKEQNALVTNLSLKQNDLNAYIKERMPELERKLDSANIKTKRVERIIVQEIKYVDTVSKRTDLKPILDAIEKEVYLKLPFEDESKCLKIKGFVEFNNNALSMDITKREYKAINQVVGSWERKQWKILGLIPTRLFGKKQTKVTVFNQCGESKTIIVDKI